MLTVCIHICRHGPIVLSCVTYKFQTTILQYKPQRGLPNHIPFIHSFLAFLQNTFDALGVCVRTFNALLAAFGAFDGVAGVTGEP